MNKKDIQLFLPLLKYYLAMVFRFGFKLYEINLIYFVAALHILQLIKHICYRNGKSFKRNI